MTHINRSDRETLRAAEDFIDDWINDVTSREAKTILSGCKYAVHHLVAGSATQTPVDPKPSHVFDGGGDALG